jgi:hypothetical protein
MNKDKLKELSYGKVPIEIELEKLMLYCVKKKGVTSFKSEEREGKFIMRWKESDGEDKMITVTSSKPKEIESLRSLFKDYARMMNKRIKDGEFKNTAH